MFSKNLFSKKSFIGSCITGLCICLLQGCFSTVPKDVINETFSKEKLQDDIETFHQIVSASHGGAYAYNTPTELDHLFDSVKASISNDLTIADFFNKVDYIVDQIGCLHTEANLPSYYIDSLYNQSIFFPMPVVSIKERLFINSDYFIIPLGSEIITVNGTPAADIIDHLTMYNHVDGKKDDIRHKMRDDDFTLNYFLTYGGSSAFKVRYREPGDSIITSKFFKAEKLSDINSNRYDNTFYFYPDDAPYDFKVIDSASTAILTVRTFYYQTTATTNAFAHFIENSFRLIKQSNIQNLVIDCRNNGGGFYSDTYKLLSFLVNEKLPEFDSAVKRFDLLPYPKYVAVNDTDKIERQDSSRSQFTEVRKGIYYQKMDEIKVWDVDPLLFKGKIFVIINNHVASAASDFASILKDKTNAFLIGDETTGGEMAHNSAVVTYELPNSHIKVDIPTKRYYQPVKNGIMKNGVSPHKYLLFTQDDVINNNDRPLHYIMDSLIKPARLHIK